MRRAERRPTLRDGRWPGLFYIAVYTNEWGYVDTFWACDAQARGCVVSDEGSEDESVAAPFGALARR